MKTNRKIYKGIIKDYDVGMKMSTTKQEVISHNVLRVCEVPKAFG